jgi:excinuclease ABC subunit C
MAKTEILQKQQISESEISSLPSSPGCYLFKAVDKEGKNRVLYVGKAKNLRSRVRSYFRADGDGRVFSEFIRLKTQSIEVFVVKDEQDALVLENELIKKHRPPYNIHLKDDKRYLSLRLDLSHEWPRLEIVRKIKRDKAIYLGPFSSAGRLKETLNIMQRLFPLRTCPDSKLYNRARPCIEYDIKRCVAPCVAYVTKEEYQELVDSVMMFLKGNTSELIEKLERSMEAAAENEQFEEAAKARDRIEAVKSITESEQSIVGHKQFQAGVDLDVLGIATAEGSAELCLVFVRNGIVWDKRHFNFKASKLDREEITSQFLSRYYQQDVFTPKEVVVAASVEIPGLEQTTHFVVPRSAEKKAFLEMAMENAQSALASRIKRAEKLSGTLDSLKEKLRLSKRPTEIDCVDISHHQGSEVVASVVRFVDGEPAKDFYRKIKLRAQTIDDFSSIREALERRYKTEEDLPQLIVIDGGKGQLSAAIEALESNGLISKTEIVSLAKARPSEEVDPLNPKNRERVFKPKRSNPILLQEDSAEELLLSFLRDEAHRFAITYHRSRKAKSLSVSVLDEVPGISSRIKLKLLRHFGSVDAIREADDAELLKFIKSSVLTELRQHLG